MKKTSARIFLNFFPLLFGITGTHGTRLPDTAAATGLADVFSDLFPMSAPLGHPPPSATTLSPTTLPPVGTGGLLGAGGSAWLLKKVEDFAQGTAIGVGNATAKAAAMLFDASNEPEQQPSSGNSSSGDSGASGAPPAESILRDAVAAVYRAADDD